MTKRIKNYKRRSISIPSELDEIIQLKFKKYKYSFINDLIVELLEIGLIKYEENEKINHQQLEILEKLDEILLCVK